MQHYIVLYSAFCFLEVSLSKKNIGLLYKCWHCGHISNIWSIYCKCGADKMINGNNNNVLVNKEKNNANYVANGSTRNRY